MPLNTPFCRWAALLLQVSWCDGSPPASFDRSRRGQRRAVLFVKPQVLREHVARMLTQVGCTAARLDLQRIARERPARIRYRASDLRVLDVAPVIALCVVRQVVVFLRGTDHRP